MVFYSTNVRVSCTKLESFLILFIRVWFAFSTAQESRDAQMARFLFNIGLPAASSNITFLNSRPMSERIVSVISDFSIKSSLICDATDFANLWDEVEPSMAQC